MLQDLFGAAHPYHGLLTATAVLAALVFVQLLVMDFAGMRAKHIPGMPVTAGHGSFHFRAVRAHGNTNENLPLQILLVVLALTLEVSPGTAAAMAWTFAGGRAGHMLFYYLDQRLARSIAFGVALIAQGVLLVACLAAALG